MDECRLVNIAKAVCLVLSKDVNEEYACASDAKRFRLDILAKTINTNGLPI